MQPNEDSTKLPDMRKKENQKLLERAKERTKIMMQADHENREQGMYDMKFANVPGEQWERNMKEQRGSRPCYEFNKLRISCKRIINDMRANRPGAKVRAVEGGDPELAQLNEGLIRNIAAISDFDTIVDYEAEFQVAAGIGAWRVTTDYVSDDAFNQDIKIVPLRNPFTLFVDPQCRDFLKRDAKDWTVTERISKEDFELRWPKATVSDFESGDYQHDDENRWTDEETVRIAEYWYKKPIKKEIWRVVIEKVAPDGSMMEPETKIVDSTTDEAQGIDQAQIAERRTIETNKICWVICSGERILEQGDWAGTMFPFVIVFGEHSWIDGRPYWWGLPRFAKDAQRSYNVARTAVSETIAQAPKSQYWATQKQAEGHLGNWKEAHKKNYPFLLYNPDPKAPNGPPARMGGADVPVALIQETQLASDEIKAVTGIFDASMGAQGNEKSGVAIARRQHQGEIATFNFQDNMSKGVQRTYEILLDLIPHIYDTERELRVLGSDGEEDYKKVNEVVRTPDGKLVKINDLAEGKYDVTVTSGPSFTTLRQEAAETYGALAQQFPELMGVAGDLVMKSMDLPYAEDIAERMRILLPPQIQEQLNADKELPPEVQEAMARVDQAMAQVEEAAMALEEEKNAFAKDKELAINERHKMEQKEKDLEIARERLFRAKAEFDAHIAGKMATLDSKEQDIGNREEVLSQSESEPDPAIVALAEHQRSVDDTLALFMERVNEAVGNLEGQSGRVPVSSKPVRENGKLYSEMTYEDGETVRIEVQDADD